MGDCAPAERRASLTAIFVAQPASAGSPMTHQVRRKVIGSPHLTLVIFAQHLEYFMSRSETQQEAI